MKPFAEDMGYHGEPFRWDEDRRALLRAELDAYYAKLYGLTGDELRYILDPKDVYGADPDGRRNFPGVEGEGGAAVWGAPDEAIGAGGVGEDGVLNH